MSDFLVEHGFAAHGFAAHGFVAHGFVAHGFVAHGLAAAHGLHGFSAAAAAADVPVWAASC
ncbi:MAG: hypothetical protein V3S83_10340 [Gemmatimonadota bacterium]